MVESVDTKDLKSFGYCSCAGSSPASGTKQHSPAPHRSIRGCVRPNFVEVGTKQHSPAPHRSIRSCVRSNLVIGTKQHSPHTKHTCTHPYFVRYTLMATIRAACAYLLAYFHSYNTHRSDPVLPYISITNNRLDRYAHGYFAALCKTRPA